ncbi:MAG: SBBP repeat-containing protein [Planctomycetota bacterium]
MYRLIMLVAILTIPAVCFAAETRNMPGGTDDSLLMSPDLEEVACNKSDAEICPEASDAYDNARTHIQTSFGKLPLYFIENQGQMDEEVAFYVRGADKTLYFTPSGITFSIIERKQPSSMRDLFRIEKPDSGEEACRSDDEAGRDEAGRWIVKMDFVDANPSVSPRGEDQQEAVFSYFKGKPEDWNTGIRTFSKIVYENLWPGIDLVYYGTANRLKYDFIVKPGVDPNDIRFAVSGASDMVLEETGVIEIKTPLGSFEDEKPTAYQEIEGNRSTVPVAYSLDRSESGDLFFLGFLLGEYDPRGSLVIDPVVLVYCGYIGGANSEGSLSSIAVDEQGNAYVTGSTKSSENEGFPLKVGPDLTYNGGDYDVFVAKVAASGKSLVYCGYIGGMDLDYPCGIVVDEQGNAYVTGYTKSSEHEGFPVKVGPDLTFNGGEDAFVAKVAASGSDLVYCGYIGGSGMTGGLDIAADSQGNAYVSGFTTCSEDDGFPVKVGPDLTFNGAGDAFVAKVAASGRTLIYCGYIGGSMGDGSSGIAVDQNGSAYITGSTESPNLPVLIGPDLTFNGSGILDGDGFVAKVTASGASLEYCGYIGGTEGEWAASIAVDQVGNAYITGSTESSVVDGFPVLVGPDLTMDPGDRDAFVAKISASGDQFLYCGYIGGGGSLEQGSDIAVDGQGNAYVTGTVEAWPHVSKFPVLLGPDLTFNGVDDAFVSKISASGVDFLYSGFIGGERDDSGSGIAIDRLGNAYVVGWTGSSENHNFPVLVGPDLTHNGPLFIPEVFVAKVATHGLYCDKYSLTAATAGTIDFNLLAGTENASNEYLLAAGISGSSPGVTLPTGLVLPLNWDFVSDLSVLLNNTAYFFDFMGTLDADGSATARFEWPGIPGSAGMSLNFAFCTRDPDEGFNFVSNPVEIELVP